MQIEVVTQAGIPLLHKALTLLSQDLGDRHIGDLAALTEAAPLWRGLLARRDEVPLGALLAAPLFSTTRGGLGLYVSDLWVAVEMRGQGLGHALLARAAQEWAPVFIKLSTYAENAAAQAFYIGVGFERQDDINMILHGAALTRLKGQP